MSINISNINSYFFTTQVKLNEEYKSKDFFCKGAIWVISINHVTNNNMEIKVSYKGNPSIKSIRLSINNGNSNEYFNIDRRYHYIHNYSMDEFYDNKFCLYKFEYDNIEKINYLTVGITLIKDINEMSYQQYFTKKTIPEGYILLPNISSINNIFIHEIQDKQYIYSKYIDQINNFNNFIDDYYDVKFEVGEHQKVIKAHRVILASRCPSFNTIFNNGILENNCINLKFPNVNYISFKALIEYLYKGRCYVPKSKKILENLLNLSYQYQINNLIEEIEEELNIDNNEYIEDNNEKKEIDDFYDEQIMKDNKDIHIFPEEMAEKLKESTNHLSSRKRKTNDDEDESGVFEQVSIKRRHPNNNFFINNNHSLEFTPNKENKNIYYKNDEIEKNEVLNKKDESDAGVFNNIHVIEDEYSIGNGDIQNEMEISQNNSNKEQQQVKNVVDMIDVELSLHDSNNPPDESKYSKTDSYEIIEINESTNETVSNDEDVYEIIDDSLDHTKLKNYNQEVIYDEDENNPDYKEEKEGSNEKSIEYEEEEEGYENEENNDNEYENEKEEDNSYNEVKEGNENIIIEGENEESIMIEEDNENEEYIENDELDDDKYISDIKKIEEVSSSTDSESDEIQQEDDEYDYNNLNLEDQSQVNSYYEEKSESEEESKEEENDEDNLVKNEEVINLDHNEIIVINDDKENESGVDLDIESSFNDQVEKEYDIESSHEDINHFGFNELNPVNNENLGTLRDDEYYCELLPNDHMDDNILSIEAKNESFDENQNEFFDDNKDILENHIVISDTNEKESNDHELYLKDTDDVTENIDHSPLDEEYILNNQQKDVDNDNEYNYLNHHQENSEYIEDNTVDEPEALEHELILQEHDEDHQKIEDLNNDNTKEIEIMNNQRFENENNNDQNQTFEDSIINSDDQPKEQQQQLNDNLNNAIYDSKTSFNNNEFEEIQNIDNKLQNQQENIDNNDNNFDRHSLEIQQQNQQQFDESDNDILYEQQQQAMEELFNNETINQQSHEEIQHIDEDNNAINESQYNDIQENDKLKEQQQQQQQIEEFQDNNSINEQSLKEQEFEVNQDINNIEDQQLQDQQEEKVKDTIQHDEQSYIQNQITISDDQQQHYEDIHDNFDNEKEIQLENNAENEIDEKNSIHLENNVEVIHLIENDVDNENTFFNDNNELNLEEPLQDSIMDEHNNEDNLYDDTVYSLNKDVGNDFENEDVDTPVHNDNTVDNIMMEESVIENFIENNDDNNMNNKESHDIINQNNSELDDTFYIGSRDEQHTEEDQLNITTEDIKEDQVWEENLNYENIEDHFMDIPAVNNEIEQGDDQMIIHDELHNDQDNHDYFNDNM